MLTELRHTLRSLARSPGFTVVAVTTLALCIGANSAIFSVVNAVLLRPLPYPDSDRLVTVYNSYPKNDLEYAGVSIPDYLDRIERAPSIEAGALYTWESLNLASEGSPSRILALRATPSLFTTLQSPAAHGRTFTAEEATVGNDKVVVLSHELWRDQFDADPEALGQSLRLDGEPHRVIGIMPPDFHFPSPQIKAWVPFAFTDQQRSISERGNEYSDMIARLVPGATPDRLSAECAAIVEQNLEFAPQFRPWVEASGFTGIAKSLLEINTEDVRSMLWLLQAGVVAALLIGCANVANLLLTRALARERDIAIRAALGASRWSIIRQLLTETLILFLLGGSLGAILAMWGIDGMAAIGATDLPRGESIQLDGTVFAFTLACAGLTGLLFGLIPALQASRPQANDALKSAGSRATGGLRQRRLRSALVVSEIALSLMLLTTAVLLARSFQRVQAEPTGFNPSNVLVARINLPENGTYASDQQRRNFVTELERDLTALPGVSAVGVTTIIPFGYGNSQGTYRIEGIDTPAGTPPPHGQIRSVSPSYFSSLQIPVLRGRPFNEFDHADAAQVVIIDQVLADKYFPEADPIGRQIYRGDTQATPENRRTIVGVVAAVKQSGLDDPMRKETIYYPYAQRPTPNLTVTLRTEVDPWSLIHDVRQTVLALDPELPTYGITTLTDRIDESLQPRRTPMLLLGLFGAMALLLAALGVYGVLAFSVGQRTPEMGIRMALGAASGDVLRLVLRQGLRLLVIGSILGIGGYLAVSRVLQHLVYDVRPLDPLALLIAGTTLLIVGLLACYLPARRATRIDPIAALRDE